MGRRKIVARLDEGADRGRRGVENRDAVFLDHFPESPEVREIRSAFIHHLGHPVGERAIDDVGMPGDPADVGGAPVNIVVAHVEDVFAGRIGAGEVAARGVEDALGLPGRSRGVENEKRVLGIKGLGLVFRGSGGDLVVPPGIALGIHVDRVAAAVEHDDALHLGVFHERLVDDRLERNDLAAPPTAVGGDDDRGSGIVQAINDCLRGKSAEDHIVHRADAGAGEHRHRRFRHHRHVNENPVLRLDPVFQKDIGETADILLELAEGDDAAVAGFSLPDDRGLVLARSGRVAVHAVLTDIEFPAHEPLRVRRFPIQHLVPFLLPGQLLGLARPELLGLVDGLLVKLLVGRQRRDAGFCGKLFRRLVDSVPVVICVGFLGAHWVG